MKKNIIIRSVLAGFMLAVFAFSITPKIILHNVVANHKDTPFASNFQKNAQVTKAGFNCSCDNLVVESPFTDDYDPFQIIIHNFYPAQIIKDVSSVDNAVHLYPALRGPPAFQAA